MGSQPASAEWQRIPVPAGDIRSVLASSGDSILVESDAGSGSTFHVTTDRGVTWSTVEPAGFPFAVPVGVAPDGSFRVVASRNGSDSTWELQVFRIAAGTIEPLGPVVSEDLNVFFGYFAIDDDGSVWLPTWNEASGTFSVTIVDSEGSFATAPLPDSDAERWLARRTHFGIRLVPTGGAGATVGIPRRETFKLGPGGFVNAEPYPVEFADGDFWLSAWSERASWDAGAHWSEAYDLGFAVPRAHGQPRFLATESGIAERYSPFLYRGAGASGGPSPYGAVDAGDALVAHDGDAVFVQPLPLPSPPAEVGRLPPDAQAMVARANLFRADAGLPPLIGDALISQAASNHSAYTAANPEETHGLGAHQEQPGQPGFTGRDMAERCAAVGAYCNSEVMYSPVPDPVGGWLATIYHRPLPGAPQAGVVGAGKAEGGWFVMNGGVDQNVLVMPFGYPVGRWRGEEGFAGEIPDPVEACQGRGQPIAYPVGIAVTLYVPDLFGQVEAIEVRRRGNPEALAGCLLGGGFRSGGSFILDDPLVRGATYDVHAVWRPGAESLPGGGIQAAAPLSHDWSFYFQPEPQTRPLRERRCRALRLKRMRSVAPERRSRPHEVLGIEEKVVMSQKGRVRLRRARFNYWIAGKRYSVRLKLGRLRRPVTVGRTSYLRFRIPAPVAPRVFAGEEAELRLAFAGRRRRGCNRAVQVSRVRKIEIGWVRVKGPVAWVSARNNRQRAR